MAAHDEHLDPVDATEPLDPLGFLGDWLSQDNDTLAASLRRFAGHDAHSLEHLRSDLDRFPLLRRRRRTTLSVAAPVTSIVEHPVRAVARTVNAGHAVAAMRREDQE